MFHIPLTAAARWPTAGVSSRMARRALSVRCAALPILTSAVSTARPRSEPARTGLKLQQRHLGCSSFSSATRAARSSSAATSTAGRPW